MILHRIGKGEKVDHFETVRTAKDGHRVDVSLSISPIKAPDGTIVGAAKVARDITAKKRDQMTLAKRAEELQRSNDDLAQFAHVASHDLQEPLRMVVSYTELLAEHLKGGLDAKAEKYIKYALDGAKRMQQLIKDLLAFSRVETQGQKPVAIDSGVVLKNVLDSLKVAIDENHAEVACDKLPAVPADAVQLAQVFQNLIGNALKFHGDRPPRIYIGAKRSNGSWQFRVEDNGIGIDKQYGELVFQMFQRLHERGRYDGSGIGLSIAKKIVERHGGRIWFEIRGGQRIDVLFHNARYEWKCDMNKEIHVLLVEDNEADVELTRDMLATNQFDVKVSVAKDGIEAIDFLNGAGSWSEPGHPTLVLLDLNLPRKDGRQVLAVLKSHDELRRIPVVVLSSSDPKRHHQLLPSRCQLLHGQADRLAGLPHHRADVGGLLAGRRQAAAPRRSFGRDPHRLRNLKSPQSILFH